MYFYPRGIERNSWIGTISAGEKGNRQGTIDQWSSANAYRFCELAPVA